MALLFPQMTSLGPGSLQRRSTTSIAGDESFDLARELQLEELLWRWEPNSWAGLHWSTCFSRRLSEYYVRRRFLSDYFCCVCTEAGQRWPGRLGVLLPDRLEVPQVGAFLGHIPSQALEEEDGPRGPTGRICHIPAGGRSGEWMEQNAIFCCFNSKVMIKAVV